MCVTADQASLRWGIERVSMVVILDALADSGFLQRRRDDTYIRRLY